VLGVAFWAEKPACAWRTETRPTGGFIKMQVSRRTHQAGVTEVGRG
jgi:hypothetical protein